MLRLKSSEMMSCDFSTEYHKPTRSFNEAESLVAGQVVDVVVTHIISPDHICVQKVITSRIILSKINTYPEHTIGTPASPPHAVVFLTLSDDKLFKHLISKNARKIQYQGVEI